MLRRFRRPPVSPLRAQVEGLYLEHARPTTSSLGPVVICEGMWDNPNHWLRLHMFVKALERERGAFRLVGILRTRRDGLQRRSLERLGVSDFRYLDEQNDLQPAAARMAREMLRPVRTHEQLLELALPGDLPAYVPYDTALKLERSPRPPIGAPVWRTALSGALQYSAYYEDLFANEDVLAVVSSHPWKNEWATLCWAAIRRGIPFYFMTGYDESVRIRRVDRTAQYSRLLEHLPRSEFDVLPEATQARLTRRGREYLDERSKRGSSDVNIQHAYVPEDRATERAAARRRLGFDPSRPLAIIFGAVWFDFPHFAGMSHFTDFLDWIEYTLKVVGDDPDTVWAVRPHPMEPWYGGLPLADVVRRAGGKIAILPPNVDTLTAQAAADAIVTCHGTVAMEAATVGIRTLCADQSYYSDWGFSNVAGSRDDYGYKLRHVMELDRPSELDQERALAFSGTALGPPPPSARYLALQDDSLQDRLYPRLLDLMRLRYDEVEHEIAAIGEWIASEHHSYNIDRIIRACGGRAAPAAAGAAAPAHGATPDA